MGKTFKGVKIFDTGNFPQGEFNAERVAEIFSNTNESVTAQFCHTSKVNKAQKDPLDMGEFSGFRLEDGSIYADIEFNEKGTMYYEDGTVNACSVEIANNEITKVAILPINEDPQILSAEFDTDGTMTFGGTMEFAEEVVLTIAEIVLAIKSLDPLTTTSDELYEISNACWDKEDQQFYVKKLEEEGYVVTAKPEEFANMTPEAIEKGIRAKVLAEFSAKETGIETFNKLKSDGKITPLMEAKGLTSEFMSMIAYKKADKEIIEFGQATYEFATVIEAILEAVPTHNMQSQSGEFAKPEGTEIKLSPSEQLNKAGL